ncbi:MAG: hypothetical protein H6718_16585 [Polyangiaceae bacterium]|nr:hypothetical protein [Myxococcales bacterium]MCB9587018.1 hypothetical protein [Polyangiaceae bacterium]
MAPATRETLRVEPRIAVRSRLPKGKPLTRRAVWGGLCSVALLAVQLVSCGAERPRPSQPRPSLLEPAQSDSDFISPAEWHYHPPEQGRMRSEVQLSGGATLFAGDRGERWIGSKAGLKAAPRLAPETLISILSRGELGWLFVGASGTTYEAESPLGEFTRVVEPLESLIEVTASGSALVGIRKDGKLVVSQFSDPGGSADWQPVKAQGATVADRFVGVELLDAKRGYALSAPERLWKTEDAGRSWTPLRLPRFGAYKLEPDGKGVIVRGVVEDRVLAGDRLAPFTGKRATPRINLDGLPPRGPDAEAITSDRATLLGDRYFELTSANSRAKNWELVVGKLASPLVVRKTTIPRECRSAKIAGFGTRLVVACTTRAADTSHPIDFYESLNSGKKWTQIEASAVGRIHQLKLALGAKGAVLVSGLCPERAERRGCRPEGVFYLGEKEDEDAGTQETAFVPASTPSLRGNALALGFSVDGTRAYVAGVRAKSSVFSVYVSKDGAKTFRPEEIEGLGDQIDEYAAPWRRSTARALRVSASAAAPDGSIGFVVEREPETKLVVTDESGRLLSMASVPTVGVAVGIVGGRALAVAPRSGEAWETQDAGGEWHSLGPLPAPVCGNSGSCTGNVACGALGCVVGGVLTRLGWGVDERIELPVLSARHDERRREVRIRTPLVCNVTEGAWHKLEGVEAPPEASMAAYGKAAWFSVAVDGDTSQVEFLTAQSGARQRVERETLLGAAKAPDQVAFHYSVQVEGATAMRYSVPKPGANITDVEVAWHNLEDDKSLKGRIADIGPYRPGDYVSLGAKRAQRATPDLISIASGGIFVRPHRLLRDNQTAYFLDGKSVKESPGIAWPTVRLGGRVDTEYVRVDGQALPLGIVGDGIALIAALSGGSFQTSALGLAEPRQYGLNLSRRLTYVDGRATFQLSYVDIGGKLSQTLLFPLNTAVDAAPTLAPSQAQLGATPGRCDADQLKQSPRIVSPFSPGTRHPILINSPSDPQILMMSGSAVLHGSAKEPCLAALDAGAVSTAANPAPSETALILLDDLEHAWLFRREQLETEQPSLVRPTTRFGVSGLSPGPIEYHAMSCSFDPDALLPPEVYAQPGTRVTR